MLTLGHFNPHLMKTLLLSDWVSVLGFTQIVQKGKPELRQYLEACGLRTDPFCPFSRPSCTLHFLSLLNCAHLDHWWSQPKIWNRCNFASFYASVLRKHMSTVRPVTGSDPDCAHLCSLLTSRHAARNIALTDDAQGNSERRRRFYLIAPLRASRCHRHFHRQHGKGKIHRDHALQRMAADVHV